MDSVDLQVLSTARNWHAAGHRVTLATVVRTWGSAPRRPGAMLAVRGDGLVVGSVSGGCVEDDLVRQARSQALLDEVRVLDYGVSREEARRFGLPCGGTLQIVLEPVRHTGWIDEVLGAIERHEIRVRWLDLPSGESHVEEGSRDDELSFNGEVLQTVHGPRWRLMLIGAGQLSRYLAEMAQALDYDVTMCDPRPEYADAWQVPGVSLVRDYPDDAVFAMRPDLHSAIVTLTHDPKLDDAALMEALKSAAFYVGALGSRQSSEARRARLLTLDLSAQEVARLHAPVGMAIGSRTPPEIAVAILAEMTAERHRARPSLNTATSAPSLATRSELTA
ncbi:MAG: XdhC family protein [Rubrivivax sp.]|nr:MAG: XdhC family protein [Rubrivivax sp.]